MVVLVDEEALMVPGHPRGEQVHLLSGLDDGLGVHVGVGHVFGHVDCGGGEVSSASLGDDGRKIEREREDKGERDRPINRHRCSTP
jgi:hypothetical protein